MHVHMYVLCVGFRLVIGVCMCVYPCSVFCMGVYVCVYVCSMHVLDWQLGYAMYIRDIYIRCVCVCVCARMRAHLVR